MTEGYPSATEEQIDLCDLLRSHGYGVVEGMDEIMKKMEEMANQPKEPMGKRMPGERCMYERKMR